MQECGAPRGELAQPRDCAPRTAEDDLTSLRKGYNQSGWREDD